MWNKTIDLIANQLNDIIQDYDVSLIVAKYYVQLRIKESINISRNFHCDRLGLFNPQGLRMITSFISITEPYSSKIPSTPINPTIYGFNGNIKWRICPVDKPTMHFIHSKQFTNREFKMILRYINSKRGFHQHYWSAYKSAWSIPFNPNPKLSLKEKIDDLNKLPESIIVSHAFQTFDWLADT